jgi:hypothetical protein
MRWTLEGVMAMKLRMSSIALLAGVGLTVAASGQAAAFGIGVSWAGTAKCFDSQSPAISLSAGPGGRARLRFAMTDLDAPNFNHGGGTVAYSGQRRLAKGAFSYRGPCPPAGQTHRYRWSAEALGADGGVLGRAQQVVSFRQ